ncbi:hypothetical protein BCR37DRAFT_375440 [Protomyces lactucae-debilis]|uniref:Retrograde transport protein Dsl1 C-terminal domain-containing protein n=1 Tax=Protomyces lactucae-debilis TaxID=2754530 RepID=A0A1Y2FUF2_PROLT|nr:uncharacterized protein BCR37DRAFT_375440 [Protomyces lactucae-debilis]ORY87579.1 hypothetical protein BCR37DRAFT_375440 [Protomyces lactucae-debilis]
MSAQLLKEIEQHGPTDAVVNRIDSLAEQDSTRLAQVVQLLDARLPEVEQQLDALVHRHGKRLYSIFADDNESTKQARQVFAASPVAFELADILMEHARTIQQLEDQLDAAHKEQSQLETLQRLDTRYQNAVGVSKAGHLCKALGMLNDLRADLESEEDAALADLKNEELSGEITRCYGEVEESARTVWHGKVSVTETALTIESGDALEDAVKAMSMLGALNKQAKALSKKIEAFFVLPILQQAKCQHAEGSIRLESSNSNGSTGLDALQQVVEYLAQKLPAEMLVLLQQYLMPAILLELQQTFLPAQLPIEVQATERIKIHIVSIREFEKKMAQLGLLSDTDLTDWIEHINHHWFVRKRDATLGQARKVILAWGGATEQVEVREDVTGRDIAQEPQNSVKQSEPTEELEEDAWGSPEWDVEDSKHTTKAKDDEEEDDAWGLDEDIPIPTTPGIQQQTFSNLTGGQKVTLSEKYMVSSLPKDLLALVDTLREEATWLDNSQSPVRSASQRLIDVVPLIMLLYRGLVPYLTQRGLPRMLLYNDLSYLATLLPRRDANLTATAESLKQFGDSFYKLEIEEKQQQLHLILDGASGFVDCTTPSQEVVCTATLQECIDLLCRLQERWEGTLSHATLLTALGNLVETVVACFTYEVMSMTDIAEQESAQLAKLGDLLSTVERKLFSNPAQDDEVQAMAAPYVPSWFKFRYCLEILEANLAYILDLYRDGSLVDFDKRELVELIQALFADSDKRRMAIGEIQGAKRWQ